MLCPSCHTDFDKNNAFTPEEVSDGVSRYRITYNPTRRTQVGKDAMEKLKIQHPDIFEEYTRTTESRTFRVKKEAA